jgi:hypothetical protein
MPDLSATQAQVRELRESRDRARSNAQKSVFELREVDAALEAARRRGDRGHRAELERRREEAARNVEEQRDALGRAQAGIRGVLAELADPRRLIEQMPDASPFLLLPLRIETKYGGTPDRRELLVRVFPDDAAVALHEKLLTTVEKDAGHEYWNAVARGHAAPTEVAKDQARQGAWNTLAGRHGAYRAGWIARATKPGNWTETVTNPATLVFPDIETKPAAWTEAPRSFVLPDRFVFTLWSDTNQQSFVGSPIADDLVLGPDPLQTEALLTRDATTGRLVVSDDLRWLIDFDRAVASGMAIRIPLAPPWTGVPIPKLIVLGIRASSSADHGAELLARLMESHRFSRGVGIVSQGTPTNNTDEAKSGFTTGAATIDETFELELNAGALTHEADPFLQTDGQRLADALAVPLELIRSFPNATETDVAEAMAMNRALWAGTLGGFMRDMMKPLVSDATIDATEEFFTRYVLGRGLLPAVRIGNQPYGILTTSALSRWQWSEAERESHPAFWNQLLGHLAGLDAFWRRELVPRVSHVGKAGDPFAHLLLVIGQQASSVEFYSRTAASDDYLWNYIRLKGTPREFATGMWEELQRQKLDNLNQLALNVIVPFKLKTLTFWRQHDLLPGPIIDGDPRVPLAEDRRIRPYDTVHNYIEWLMTATRAELEGEIFHGADGKPVASPAALLYQLLRHAYLAELGRGGLLFAKIRAAAAFAEMPDEPAIANVGASKALLRHDIMNLDTAKVGVTHESLTVADYLLDHARSVGAVAQKPSEAVPLASMTRALERLAPLSTARLERLFAEHLDLCGYRLDAWIQGLFSRRLDWLRTGRHGQGGIHLGACGWVEDLRPKAGHTRPVALDQIVEPLRADVTGTVVEYVDDGGFVHAPSLTHAVSAAVLRNAYLSHAEPSRAGVMSVNLSSSRVRTALSYLEGLRNGQELSALLGYQLERGLHERHPGIELDEFIYVLRERFPLTSNKLTAVPDGTSAEVIEARNVVNGYDLLDFVRGKAYPYGLAGLPADAARSGPIIAEVDRLADAMDAISDLLLSESVHQVVQGNYDRAKGVLQAVTEGDAPPDIDIVRTPRSGRGLTHRVAIQCDPANIGGWGIPLSARAAANAPLNHWLTTVLPAPTAIQWQVTLGASAPQFVGLDTLGLEPIDVVLMCGDEHGRMSSELEQFLAASYRETHAVPDEVQTFTAGSIEPSVPVAQRLVIDVARAAPGHLTAASVWPLLKSLRRLVSQSRPLHAKDFMLPSEAQPIAPSNPKGHDAADLKARIETVHATLTAASNALGLLLTGTVKPLYDALKTDPSHTVTPAWTAILSSLRAHLFEICRFGVPEALPGSGVSAVEASIDALVLQAQTVHGVVGKRLAQARDLLDVAFADPLPTEPDAAARALGHRIDVRIDSFTDAAKLLMGRSFVPVPLYSLHPEGRPELQSALAAPIVANPLAVEEWLQSLTRVRAAIGALGWVLTYHDWLHAAPLSLVPVQLPVHAGDAWIGTAYGTSLADGDVLSIAICNPTSNVAAVQCGLMVDEWTEVVPTTRETTGLAFHANRPNAQPPQALLLAVAPAIRGTWRWDDLLAIVSETIERAKIRAVEPDMVATTKYFQVMPAVLTEFSTRIWASTSFVAKAALARQP